MAFDFKGDRGETDEPIIVQFVLNVWISYVHNVPFTSVAGESDVWWILFCEALWICELFLHQLLVH